MSNIPTGTTLNGYPITYWNRQTVADGDEMSLYTIIPICSAINDNIKSIETMQAATDVINVYGTYSAFESESGEMVEAGYLTDYDIVKVLQDEENDDMQTYWQCHKEGDIWTWECIGNLAPYYSKNDINEFSASLSGTISSNYYASGNVTTAGKNLSATQTAVNGAPKVEISIKDKVEFVTVSASDGFSGTNISGDGKTATIKNLIISAEGGSAANKWLDTNSKKYISAISSDDINDNVNIKCTISTAYNGSATTAKLALSGYKTYFSLNDYVETGASTTDYTLQYQLTNKAISYMNQGHEASAWIDSGDYVKHTETGLKIGHTATLAVDGAATALGKYASASNYSFALSFGANNTQKIYASDKGFAVGDTNSASFNSFIIGHNNLALGSNEASNKFIIGVGNTIVNTVTNSYIIGANNTNDQPGLIILGNDAKQNHNLGDILAVGNGGSDDALLLNTNSLYVHPKYDTFNQLTAGVKISNDGIYFRTHTKIYPSIELFGKEIFTTTREDMSLDSIFFNTLLLNGTELFNNKFGAYITKEVSLAHTNTIKIFSTNIHYDFRIGVPMEYTVILKGFNPYNGLTQNQIDSGIRNLHYITTNSTGVSWGSETDTGTYITSASYIKQANQPSASVQTWCLWINNMSTDQYIDCTIDRANKYLIMIKGGFGGNN